MQELNPNSLVTPKVLANQLGTTYRNLCWLVKLASTDISSSDLGKKAYEKLSIPTKSKVRTCYSPCNSIRSIQAMLVQVVLRYIDPGDSSRAYEPGMQLKTAGEDMLGGDVVVGLDIKDFFHSIKRSMVVKLFVDEGYPLDTSRIMARLCCVADKYTFLPQGGIASAAIANRYAAKYLDPIILDVCRSMSSDAEFKYIRYSDNIYVCLHGDFIGYSYLKKIADAMASIGWRTHKFRVMPYYRRQKLLGMVVNNSVVTIQRTDFRKMCSALHNISKSNQVSIIRNLEELSNLGIDTSSFQKLEMSLKGKVSYYIQMSESTRQSKLRKLYSEACLNIDKHRSSIKSMYIGG